MNPAPIVRTFTMSFKMAALTKKVTIAAQINNTRSIGGILSVTPAITARKVGISAECRRTIPNQPMDSAVLGRSLCSRKCLIEFLT